VARYWFGQTLTDWAMVLGAATDDGSGVLSAPVSAVGPVTITFWNQPTGGSQYTDLLDASGTPITQVTVGDGTTYPIGTIPRVQGPDSVTVMWADGGAGIRYKMVADLSDLPGQLDDLAGGVEGVESAIEALATVATTGEYDDLINKPTLAAVATSGAYSDLSGAPAPGLQIVTKVGATWPVRASTAPDTSRMAAWVGPPPAPPAGGGYALPGDLWWPTP